MRWRALDKRTIKADSGHQISRATVDGVDAYSAWGPPGSASKEQRDMLAPTMALAAKLFDAKPQADARAVARAQRLIGVYACPQEARAACEDKEG